MSQINLLHFTVKLSCAHHMRLVILLVAVLATAHSAAAARETTPARPPNILFVFCDDHAYQAISAYQSVSAYGLKLNDTPNIDRLARRPWHGGQNAGHVDRQDDERQRPETDSAAKPDARADSGLEQCLWSEE